MVAELQALGIRVVMLTGDTEAVARHVAAEAGVDTVYADLLPERKVELVRELEAQYGGVAMVGDGVNDAPALAAATLGVAMGAAGTDVALETADVVLMADDLGKLPYLLRLSRRTRRTLAVNIGVSLGAIAVMIVTILGAGLALPLAVVGHEGSTVLVSLNGLRLLGGARPMTVGCGMGRVRWRAHPRLIPTDRRRCRTASSAGRCRSARTRAGRRRGPSASAP